MQVARVLSFLQALQLGTLRRQTRETLILSSRISAIVCQTIHPTAAIGRPNKAAANATALRGLLSVLKIPT